MSDNIILYLLRNISAAYDVFRMKSLQRRCILEASLSRTPVQALDLLPSYLCNPHRRCGRDGMEVGSVALVDSYVAVKFRLPGILVILVSRKDLQHANKA